MLGRLVEWLRPPEQTGLRRSFVVWMRRVMLPHRAPGMELPPFNDLQDLHEVHDMLAERIKHWPDRWIEEGRQEGRQEGLQEGRRETARNLIRSTEMDDRAIAEIVGLTIEEVTGLRENPPQ